MFGSKELPRGSRRASRACCRWRGQIRPHARLGILRSLAANRELAPTGRPYAPSAFVFGELGQQTGSVDQAWATCVLKAHGHQPTYRKTGLNWDARAALKAIDLHFYDLRHEGASRLLEAGCPLHHIREMLGHASLEQTSTYLKVQKGGLPESMRRLDRMANATLVAHSCHTKAKPSDPAVS